jgi:hypothetical protein
MLGTAAPTACLGNPERRVICSVAFTDREQVLGERFVARAPEKLHAPGAAPGFDAIDGLIGPLMFGPGVGEDNGEGLRARDNAAQHCFDQPLGGSAA